MDLLQHNCLLVDSFLENITSHPHVIVTSKLKLLRNPCHMPSESQNQVLHISQTSFFLTLSDLNIIEFQNVPTALISDFNKSLLTYSIHWVVIFFFQFDTWFY